MAAAAAMEKSKSFAGYPSSYSDIRSDFEERSKSYSFNRPNNNSNLEQGSANPEMKRRKRVAYYNMYTAEAKLKSSLRNSFKWIKTKFSNNFYDIKYTQKTQSSLAF